MTANCLNPGPTATRLGDNMSGIPRLISSAWKNIRQVYPERGAEPLVYVASSPQLESLSGRFFRQCHDRPTKRITHDRGAAERLWPMSAALCGMP